MLGFACLFTPQAPWAHTQLHSCSCSLCCFIWLTLPPLRHNTDYFGRHWPLWHQLSPHQGLRPGSVPVCRPQRQAQVPCLPQCPPRSHVTLHPMSRECHALRRARHNAGLHEVPRHCKPVAVASCVSRHINQLWSAVVELSTAAGTQSSPKHTAFLCCRLLVAFSMAAFVVCISVAALIVAAVLRIKATQRENLADFQSVEARRKAREDAITVPETQATVVTQPDG